MTADERAPIPKNDDRAVAEEARRRGDFATAARALRRAARERPEDVGVRRALAAVLDQGGDGAAAIGELRRAIALDPGDPGTHRELGLMGLIEGFTDDAALAYDRLSRLSPGEAEAMAMRARLHLLDGAVTEAHDLCVRALTANPTLGEAAAGADRARRYARLIAMAADDASPRGLAVRGPFRDTSGYAHMTRHFIRGLARRGVRQHLLDVQLNFVPLFNRDARAPDLEAMAETPLRASSMLNFTIPSMVERLPGVTPLSFTMFEARTVPAAWVRHAARLPSLIVPSVSSRDAWVDRGVPPERVALCPLGVDVVTPGSIPPVTLMDGDGRRLSDHRVRVLNVSDLCDRKNIDGLIRVWLRATRPGDDIALVLKLGKGAANDRERAGAYMHKVAATIGKRLADAAPIFLVQGVLSDDDMAGLFAACSHYWSMSHGEGWDLPMTQAGAMGLSLIAPRHSAYTTYLDDDVATLLPTRVVPAIAPYAGLEWWNPDEDVAAELIAAMAAGDSIADRSAREHLATNFSWDRACDRLFSILDGMGVL